MNKKYSWILITFFCILLGSYLESNLGDLNFWFNNTIHLIVWASPLLIYAIIEIIIDDIKEKK